MVILFWIWKLGTHIYSMRLWENIYWMNGRLMSSSVKIAGKMERGDGQGERGDYVNEIEKVRRLPQSSFSLWFSLGLWRFSSSPMLSLALPLCRMSDPVSAAPQPAWETHKASDKTQTKTLDDVPCAGPWVGITKLSLSSLLCTLSLFFSFIHTHIKLRVQTKSQELAGNNRHSRICLHYQRCRIT